MLVVDLRDFGGGKIFNDQFNLMVPKSVCEGGTEIELKYRGNSLGTVEVIAKFSPFANLYQDIAAKVSNQKKVEPGNEYLLIVKYKERNLATHAELMEEWWNGVKTSQQILQQ